MINLIKYELKRTLSSKLIILGIIGVLEGFFLLSLPTTDSNFLPILGLVLFSAAAYIYVAFEVVFTLFDELNSTRGYMLFMTPNTPGRILLSKIIAGLIQLILTSIILLMLMYIDIFLALKQFHPKNTVSLSQLIINFIYADESHEILKSSFAFGLSFISKTIFMILSGCLATLAVAYIDLGNKVFKIVTTFFSFVVLIVTASKLVETVISCIIVEKKAPGLLTETGGPTAVFTKIFITGLHPSDILSPTFIETSIITMITYAVLSTMLFFLNSWLLGKKVEL